MAVEEDTPGAINEDHSWNGLQQMQSDEYFSPHFGQFPPAKSHLASQCGKRTTNSTPHAPHLTAPVPTVRPHCGHASTCASDKNVLYSWSVISRRNVLRQSMHWYSVCMACAKRPNVKGLPQATGSVPSISKLRL
jgi:hypothetical protein